MKNGVPGPEGSLGKWQWAEVNQHLMELAMEIEGPYGQFADGSEYSLGGDWQYQFLRTRANSIEGGTTDILRNIVAERVLGLPKLR
jgi:alkylation response protein AidB-like acyl-CoA dehydrogenase